MEMSSKFRI